MDLDSLLGQSHAGATFHDASVLGIDIDYVTRVATFRMSVNFEGSDGGDDWAPGVLRFTGLLYLAAEAPSARLQDWAARPLWLVADGPLPDEAVHPKLPIPPDLPKGTLLQYLCFGDTNAFMVVAAAGAEFEWSEG